MAIKITDVITKSDWLKMGILLIVAVACWVWVYTEYQKPVIPPEWEKQINADII